MKIKFIALVIVTAFISTAAIQVGESDITTLKNELKRELRPDYKYDSSKISDFNYSSKTQIKEIEVPLFFGEQYRFLFNTADAKGVKIEIHTKPATNSNRKAIFSTQASDSKTVHIFEPEKSSKMYITYLIPENLKGSGNVIFVLGYK